MKRQIFILAVAQMLFQIVMVAVMTVGGLAGAQIADSPRWATLPIATIFLGTAIMMFPASLLMAKIGRKKGFLLGTLLGVAGGIVASLGVWWSSLWVLALGTFLLGTYQAFAQFYRFAASEVASKAYRSRAISLVLAGGVVAAIVGPYLAKVGGPLLEPQYLGSFLLAAVVTLLAVVALFGFKNPSPQQDEEQQSLPARPWQQMVMQPKYLVALFSAATGYGVMILGMTAAPIAMLHMGFDLSAAATVIQLHVLGMFFPSFFTGGLIARFGVAQVMLAGLVILLAYVGITVMGTGFTEFAVSLTLLGVGWNFLYIGGTTLLTETYRPSERARAQAINDLVIFILGVTCSFAAGGMFMAFGWAGLNVAMLPWLLVAVVPLVWLLVARNKKPVEVAS